MLVHTLYLSVDPYMRSRMNEGKSYVPPFEINGVITGGVVGEVVESRSPAFQPGDIVRAIRRFEEGRSKDRTRNHRIGGLRYAGLNRILRFARYWQAKDG